MMLISQQQIDELQNRLGYQFNNINFLLSAYTQYFHSAYYYKKKSLFKNHILSQQPNILTIQKYQEALRESRRYLMNTIRLILTNRAYSDMQAEQLVTCIMEEMHFESQISFEYCLTREKDFEFAKAQMLFIVRAIWEDCKHQQADTEFLAWLKVIVDPYIEQAIHIEVYSKKELIEQVSALKDELDVYHSDYYALEEHCASLEESLNALGLENERLRYQLTYQEEKKYQEQSQEALTTASLLPYGFPVETKTLSSRIVIDYPQKANFTDKVLALPSKGLTTAARLSPLRPCIPQEEDGSEYFKQFPDYILEEIRAGIHKQLKTITRKNLLPFPATVDLSRQVNLEQENVRWSCTTTRSSLPKLDHGFFQEAVLIQTSQAHYDYKTKKYKNDELSGILAIASLSDYSFDRENDNRNVEIKLIFPKDEYLEQIDHWKKRNGKIQLHWLTGLIPSERMYDVCMMMPTVSFQAQFIRGSLSDWPEENVELPDKQALERLNPIQRSVVSRLQQLESGLYFLQGPPGTGKTTTAVSLLMQLTALYPTKRILVCASTNQAVRVILANTKKLLDNVAMALTGIARDIPEELKDVFVHNYAQELYRQLIVIKKQFHPNINAKSARSFVAKAEEQYSQVIEKLTMLVDFDTPMPIKSEVKRSIKNLLEHILADKSLFLEDASDYLASYTNDKNLDVRNTHRESLINMLEDSIQLIQDKSHDVESFLVQRAQLVFATLVSSGRNWLRKQISQFDIIVLDEAAQALIPEALIPIAFNPELYIQIGDPNQLPATVVSDSAQDGGFQNSMMHALTKELNQPYEMLNIQYRMHQSICNWPSQQYYKNSLITAPNVLARNSILNNPKLDVSFRSPCLFFNIENAREERRGPEFSASISNHNEAESVVSMVGYLINKCGFQAAQIGVITFYSAQLELLKRKLNNMLSVATRRDLVVSTVDGFQGEERDITLISVVRTSKSVGFLNDSRRLNVAMTRAKQARWIFGLFKPLNKSNSDLPGLLAEHVAQNNLIPEDKFRKIVRP